MPALDKRKDSSGEENERFNRNDNGSVTGRMHVGCTTPCIIHMGLPAWYLSAREDTVNPKAAAAITKMHLRSRVAV